MLAGSVRRVLKNMDVAISVISCWEWSTGAVLLHGATNYHVVRASDGFTSSPSSRPGLSETFVDIRAFSMTDWAGHPQLASALVQANQQQLLGDSAASALQESVNQLLPDWPKK